MDAGFQDALEAAASVHAPGGFQRMPSGAGHDAAAMAALTPVAMLFVRCKGGVSHHPEESVSEADIAVAIETMSDFVMALASKYRAHPHG